MKLNEGMRPNDLEDLVLPMITIDEFESKVDDQAIVIGFYINEKEGADDLNRFIQKSSLQILDTDISPAPDQHGYYLVFVEFINDDQITENISSLLKEVSPLTGNEKWQVSLRGVEGIFPFSSKKISQRFKAIRDQKSRNKVIEFFKNSDLTNVILENGKIYLEGYKNNLTGNFVSIGLEEEILISHNLHENAVVLDLNMASEYLKIARYIGEGWSADRVGDYTLLKQIDSEIVLLLKDAHFI